MSTATRTAPVRRTVTADPSITSIPFGRLLRVELRKLVDTRAGFWLLAAIGIITAAVVVAYLFAADPEQLTFVNFIAATATPQGFLLPVLGILEVTAEWSQRTGLVTFTLEPSRARIAAAKLVAVVLVGLLAVAMAYVVAALGNVAGIVLQDGAGGWTIEAAGIRDFAVLPVVGVAGFAFGMLLMNTAAAIVLYYVSRWPGASCSRWSGRSSPPPPGSTSTRRSGRSTPATACRVTTGHTWRWPAPSGS